MIIMITTTAAMALKGAIQISLQYAHCLKPSPSCSYDKDTMHERITHNTSVWPQGAKGQLSSASNLSNVEIATIFLVVFFLY